jgi:hypothetical protein
VSIPHKPTASEPVPLGMSAIVCGQFVVGFLIRSEGDDATGCRMMYHVLDRVSGKIEQRETMGGTYEQHLRLLRQYFPTGATLKVVRDGL